MTVPVAIKVACNANTAKIIFVDILFILNPFLYVH